MKRFIGAIILSLSVVPVMIYIDMLMSYLFRESYFISGINRSSDHCDAIYMTISITPAVVMGCIYWLAIWAPMVRWNKFRLICTLLLIVIARASALGVIFADLQHTDKATAIGIGNTLFAVAFILGSIPLWKRTKKDHITHLDDNSSYPPLKDIILCPLCQTDMTNLAELICPGCEKHYSINELLSHHSCAPTTTEIQNVLQDNTQSQASSQGTGQ